MLTWVEVDSKAILHNLKQFRKLIGSEKLLMPVIKANAYGHGFLEVAKICQLSREVDRICVVNIDEALQLIAHHLIKKPIVILSFYELDEKKITRAVKAGVTFPVYNIIQAKFLNKIGKKLGKKIKIHVKIDTGASRLGILPNDTTATIVAISKLANLNIEGIFSHFASSETDKMFTEYQLKQFDAVISQLKKRGINIPIKHFACSSAGILYAQSRFNGVRLGLSLYGLYPDDSSRKKINLRPALSWYTKIIQIKTVPAWTKIGYGGTFTTKKTTRLAIIPVGYYDGYDRRFSNAATVLVGGKKYPIRGRICMNLTIVDITGSKSKVGDKVSLIGKFKKQTVTVDDLAKIANTINYEIVDRINPLIPKIVI